MCINENIDQHTNHTYRLQSRETYHTPHPTKMQGDHLLGGGLQCPNHYKVKKREKIKYK